MLKTKPMLLTEQNIRDCLPVPPFRFKYLITQQSPQVWRVDLLHPAQYSYTTEQVKTIWGFIKNGKVYPPLNYKKPRAKVVCDLTDIPDSMYYTTIVPTQTSLHD